MNAQIDPALDQIRWLLRRVSGLSFAFVTGSYLYGRAQKGSSDVDLVLVLNGKQYRGEVDFFARQLPELLEGIGYVADPEYPLEAITLSYLQELAIGCDLPTDPREGLIYLEPDPWTPQVERRLHFFQLVFSKGGFLVGDQQVYERFFRDAWGTLRQAVAIRGAAQDEIESLFSRFKVNRESYTQQLLDDTDKDVK